MAESAAEKNHGATPQRRQQAREAGQFAKSQDLISATVLLASLAAIWWLGNSTATVLRNFTESRLSSAGEFQWTPESAVAQWRQALHALTPVVLPLLVIAAGGGVLANLMQTGLLWLPHSVMPDASRISPASGLRRIASPASLFRLGFGVTKLAAVCGLTGWCLHADHETLLGLAAFETPQLAAYLANILVTTALKVAGLLFAIALADYGFQWWKHEQSLRMTNDELREEQRNLQGDPQLAARRRVLQRQMLSQRVETAVPTAQLVVTGEGTRAIALRYDPVSMSAPILVAKGSGEQARRIGRVALEHAVPVVEDPDLAQALEREAQLGQGVPPRLFSAVADRLAAAMRAPRHASRARSAEAAGISGR